jgi:hypothetical protein
MNVSIVGRNYSNKSESNGSFIRNSIKDKGDG